MTHTRIIGILAVALAVSACGGSDSSDPDNDAPACTDVFTTGRPTTEVVAQYDNKPCIDENGDRLSIAHMFWDCGDGTAVHEAGDYGWGRDGDVWQGPEVPRPPSTSADGAQAGCP